MTKTIQILLEAQEHAKAAVETVRRAVESVNKVSERSAAINDRVAASVQKLHATGTAATTALTGAQRQNATAATALATQTEKTGQAAKTSKRSFEDLSRTLKEHKTALLGVQIAIAAVEAVFLRMVAKNVTAGVRFNSTVEDAKIGVAALLRTFEPEKFKTFDDATSAAGRAIDRLREKALKSPATFAELVQSFQAISGAALGAQIPLERIIDLTVLLSQSIAGFGLKGNQIVQESRALITGNIGPDSTVARALQIRREDIQRATQAGTLFEFLTDKLKAFSESGDRAQVSLTGLISNLGDTVDQTLGEATKRTFETIKAGLESLQETVRSPEFKQDLSTIASGIDLVVGAGLKLADFSLHHTKAITALVVGVGAASAAVSAAVASIAAIKLAGGISSFLLGVEAAKSLSGNVALIGQLITATKAWIVQAGIASKLAPFAGVAVGLFAAYNVLRLGQEAWGAYKAAKEEALATGDLEKQNDEIRVSTERLIAEMEKSGKLTADRATELKKQIEDAFKVEIKTTLINPGGFAPGQVVKETVRFRDREHQALKAINTELRKALTSDQDRLSTMRQTAESIEIMAAAQAAAIEGARALQRFDEAALQDSLDRGLISIEEFTRRREELAERAFRAETLAIRDRADIEGLKALEALQERAAREGLKKEELAREEADTIRAIEIKANGQLEVLRSQQAERLLQIDQEASQISLQREQAVAQARISIAEESGRAIEAARLRVSDQFRQLRENLRGQLSPELSGQIDSAERLALLRAETQIFSGMRDTKLRLLEIERARIETDTTPDTVARQNRLNDVLTRQNAVLSEQVAIQGRLANAAGLTEQERLEALGNVLQTQERILENNRRLDVQEATNLPGFQAALGFQNRLDVFGRKTGEREMIAPFAALDDFLNGTLRRSFDGIADVITDVALRTGRWMDIAVAAGREIIGSFIRMALEYTLFNQIRTALDASFYGRQRAHILTTSTTAKVAQLAQAQTATAAGAQTAAAYAPASAAANTATFGASAAVGLGITLAAIAAIVAALSGAFAEGGIVRGPGGPREDNILARVRPGTGILNAAAVQHFGGQAFVDRLERARFASRAVSALSSPGGTVPIRVSAGEALLSPEAVAFLGRDVIEAINQRRLKLGTFAEGGIAMPAISRALEGYAVGGIAGQTAKTIGHVMAPLEANAGKDSIVNVPAPTVEFLYFDDREAFFERLKSPRAEHQFVAMMQKNKLRMGIG